MTSLKNDYKSVHESIQAFIGNIEPTKNRFYTFLLTHDPKGFAEYWIDENMKADGYSVDFTNGLGVVFTAEEWDYDDVNHYYFHIPDDYLDDPEAWETHVLKTMAEDGKLAETVLLELFGVFRGVNAVRRGNSPFVDARFLVIELGDKYRSRGATPEQNFMLGTTSPCAILDRESGEIYVSLGDRAVYEINAGNHSEIPWGKISV